MSQNLLKSAENLSDDQLVSLISEGDYEYLQVLINRYMPYIISIANKYKTYGCDAEDLIQEGVLAVFSAVKTFEGEKSSFRTFVSLCINRSIIGQVRAVCAQKRVPENLITSIDEVDLFDENSPENILIEKESYNALADTLKSELSEFEYQVFCEFLSGKSYSDISSDLSVTTKAVDNALRRIRAKFKR